MIGEVIERITVMMTAPEVSDGGEDGGQHDGATMLDTPQFPSSQ